MTDAPAPLSPPDCDLRGYDFMPLFGHRVFRSRWYSLALKHPRAGLAAVKLWWEAWQQCPAGSLPNDDDDLARMADFGADLKGWSKVRDVALHGFVLCSDGRLYHELLCKEAQVAFAKRVKERTRKAAYRAKGGSDEGGTGGGSPGNVPRDKTRTDGGQERGQDQGRDAAVPADRTGQGQDRTDSPSSLRSDGPPRPPPDPRGTRLPPDWQPSEADRTFAAELGLNPEQVAEEFRGYWCPLPGPKARKLDWSMTFRNRCRDRAERNARFAPKPPRDRMAELFAVADHDGELSRGFDDRQPNAPGGMLQ